MCLQDWNSEYLVFQRLHKLKDAISLLLTEPGMHDNVGSFGSDQWEALTVAVEVLEPGFEATEQLSGKKFATGS